MVEAISWSAESLEDIDSIAEFISRDSFYYAEQVVNEIFTAGESLQINAMRGRVVPELKNPQIRELFIYSYRLIYQLRGQEIEMLAVIHGKRLLVG